MRLIGITGSIACGKSTVSRELFRQGYPVIDGDVLARELTGAGGAAMAEIGSVFGNQYIAPDGSLNRRMMGQLVFSDPAARARLDQLMAPYLRNLTMERIDQARASGASLCFLDMPLLFEKGYDRLCNAVWTVWIPESVQMRRLMERDGFSQEEARRRMSAVLSPDEKAARSDRVIDNSGTVEETYNIVSGFLREELSDSCIPDRNMYTETACRRGSVCFPHQESPAAQLSRQPDSIPSGMERPAKSAHHTSRKAAWRMPVWLKTSLVAGAAAALIGFTALMLMDAYLTRRQDEHYEEQRQIDIQYPLAYRDLIEKYAAEYNLSPAYVAAIIRNESSFQPKAESGVGARGLMQLMPDTAEWIAGKLKVSGYAFERMFDPESNIRFGCWYLNYLSRLFLGDPVSVTAAYHAGQGQVKTWLSDPLLSENGYTMPLSSMPEGPTKSYAGRVIRDYGIYQEKYFEADIGPADPVGSVSRISGVFFIH